MRRDDPFGRIVPLLMAVLALILAAVLGSDPFYLVAAFVFFLGAFLIPGPRLAAVAAFVPPVLLAWGLRLPGIYTWQALVALLTMALAIAPFYMRLGGGLPFKRTALFLLFAVPVPLLLLLHPAAPTLLASDMAPRLQVTLVGLGTLLALVGVSWWPTKSQGGAAPEPSAEDFAVLSDTDESGPSR